ncbi:hypothetical protein V490_01564 [Pseudogymnoascus sp. VKM F-3557]|nr:hypothetical protein V490_01564 [Pseudogymnoascus sp. VKM F-3557]
MTGACEIVQVPVKVSVPIAINSLSISGILAKLGQSVFVDASRTTNGYSVLLRIVIVASFICPKWLYENGWSRVCDAMPPQKEGLKRNMTVQMKGGVAAGVAAGARGSQSGGRNGGRSGSQSGRRRADSWGGSQDDSQDDSRSGGRSGAEVAVGVAAGVAARAEVYEQDDNEDDNQVAAEVAVGVADPELTVEVAAKMTTKWPGREIIPTI